MSVYRKLESDQKLHGHLRGLGHKEQIWKMMVVYDAVEAHSCVNSSEIH